ncbi:MAG: flagellar biosynthetic protein FliO [Proteobacteria bacterium]|nr:flagellar biosynthetic protein FliO [Pseudomonadota bacterium]
MAQVSLTQVIVVLGFLAALIAMQVVLRRHAQGIGKRLARGRDIRLLEVAAIGTHERLSLVEANRQRILVLTGRNGTGAFLPLGPAAPDTPETRS